MARYFIMFVAFSITILLYTYIVLVIDKLLKTKNYRMTNRGKILIGSVLCCVFGLISGMIYVHYFI